MDATLGAANAVEEVGGDAHESLPHLVGLFGPLDGGEGNGARTSITSPVVAQCQWKVKRVRQGCVGREQESGPPPPLLTPTPTDQPVQIVPTDCGF